MNRKYYIINNFEYNNRLDWAELFILPADTSYTSEALFITIDCIGESPRNDEDEMIERHKERKTLIGDSDYYL